MKELLILNLGGMKYGVWKEGIVSIKDIKTIHRLPLSPTCIAGMSILDGRTVTLADLAVCIGLPPMSREKAGHILIVSEQEKVPGFVFEGDFGSLSVSSDEIFPMPDYLKTPVIDTCAVYDSEPIPVINISMLYSRIQNADREPAVAEFTVSGIEQRDIASVKSVRIFESGEELFAAPAAGIEDEATKPGNTSRLALTPKYVRGIVHHNGRIMPLISLSLLMKLPRAGKGRLMLAADMNGAGFGFLVETDKGTLFGADFTIKPAPPLARSSWMRGVVMRDGNILPLIDLYSLISSRSGEEDGKSLPRRYSPDSRFHSVFGKEDLDVLEFTLLGARHALPKSEIEDTIRFKPYRQVPNVQPIVVGVTEHNGDVLPVLDLAMCFGRRSLVTPEWSMILVKNGDFRALVITEAVFGKRRIPVDMQRAVPIVVPHRIVYGCYPEANTVKLILNVEALAVHFDKSLVKELLPALSKEMELTPAEIVPALMETEFAEGVRSEESGAVIGAKAGETHAREQEAEIEEQKEEEEVVTAANERIEEPAFVAPVESDIINKDAKTPAQIIEAPAAVPEPQSEPQSEPVPEPQPQTQTEPQPQTAAAPEPEPQPEPALVPGPGLQAEPQPESQPQPASEPVPESESQTETQPVPEQEPEPQPQTETQPMPEPATKLEHAQASESIPGSGPQFQPEPELMPEQEQPQLRHHGSPEPQAQPEPQPVSSLHEQPASASRVEAPAQEQVDLKAVPEVVPPSYETVEEPVKEQAAAPAFVAMRDERREAGSGTREIARTSPEPIVQERPFGQKYASPRPAVESAVNWKRWVSYAAAGAALLLILYISGVFEKTGVEKIEKPEKFAAKGVEKTILPEKPKPQPQLQPQPEPRPEPQLKPEPQSLPQPQPLPLVAPVSEIYEVKRGDTLWHISKRFTGNPFNYPRVAKENEIKNPDLIFPGQRIVVNQEGAAKSEK